jgi:hypothetical protein
MAMREYLKIFVKCVERSIHLKVSQVTSTTDWQTSCDTKTALPSNPNSSVSI